MPQKHWWCNTSAPSEIYTKMETRDLTFSPWNSHSYPEGSLPTDKFRKELESLFRDVICKQDGKVKMEKQFKPSENETQQWSSLANVSNKGKERNVEYISMRM